MKPILLKIEGFNSFEKEKTINFEKLIEGGIFGIFGATGSGKSTIIDAIIMCLYGNLSRYSIRSNNQYINSNCNKMALYFKFELDNNIYEITREYKKTKDSIINSRLLLVENESNIFDGKNKKEVFDNKIKNLIGLEYEDFLKAVILPQGKFSELLLMSSGERFKILERILRFEKYGENLTKKVKFKAQQSELQISNLEEQLKSLEYITEEYKKNNLNYLKEKQLKIVSIEKEIEQIKNDIDELKGLQSLNQKHIDSLVSKRKLETKKEYIESKNIILEKAIKAERLEELYNRYCEKKTVFRQLHNEVESITAEYNTKKEEHEIIKQSLEKITLEKEEKYIDLINKEDKIKKNIYNLKEYEKLESKIQKSKINYNTKEQEYDVIEKSINKTDENISKIDNKTKEMIIIENKLTISPKIKKVTEEACKIKDSINNKEAEKDQYKIQIQKIKEIIEENRIEAYLNIMEQKNIYEYQQNEISKTKEILCILRNKIIKTEEIIKNLIIEKEYINNKNIILTVANQLKEGENCPVCGSLEHPNIAESKDIRDIIKVNEEIRVNSVELKEIQIDIENENNKLTSLKHQNMKDSIEKLEDFFKNFKEDNFCNNDNLQNKILEFKNNMDKTIDINIKQLDKFKIKIGSFKTIEESKIKEKDEKTIKLKQLEEEIRILKYELEEKIDIIKKYKNESVEKNNIFEYYEYIQKSEEKLNNLIIEKTKLIKMRDEYVKGKFDLIEERGNLKIQLEVIQATKKGDLELQKKIEIDVEILEQIEKIPINTNIKIETDINTYRISIFLKNIQTEIQKINNGFEENTKKLEQSSQILFAANNSKISICAKIETVEKDNKLLEEEFYKKIKQYDFETEEEFLLNIKTEKHIEQLKIEINNFKKQIEETEYNINKVLEQIKEQNSKNYNLNEIDNVLLEKVKEKIEIENQHSNIRKEIIELEVEKFKICENMERKSICTIELEHNMKKYRLLDEMNKLLAYKGFLKFVSEKQLKYIMLEATRKLKSMTSGRYNIELENNEIVIIDNFNSGFKRSPKTLSGGEIFVVSLCLSLALSSSIQLKNSVSLEFFFLDEGFGTLDDVLLQKVIDSLEQLRDEKLFIGIISHVKEIRERISHRLIVIDKNSTGEGTDIILEV